MSHLDRAANAAQWIVGVATLAAALMLFTLDGSPQSGVTPVAAEIDGLVDTGREIYGQHCASCHGDTGKGGQGPRIAGTVVTNYPDAADEISLVTRGRGAMPPFAQTLTDDEVIAVVAFTRFGLS